LADFPCWSILGTTSSGGQVAPLQKSSGAGSDFGNYGLGERKGKMKGDEVKAMDFALS
jgi:hypothetical protein